LISIYAVLPISGLADYGYNRTFARQVKKMQKSVQRIEKYDMLHCNKSKLNDYPQHSDDP
jgi:hypothetical protein